MTIIYEGEKYIGLERAAAMCGLLDSGSFYRARGVAGYCRKITLGGKVYYKLVDVEAAARRRTKMKHVKAQPREAAKPIKRKREVILRPRKTRCGKEYLEAVGSSPPAWEWSEQK